MPPASIPQGILVASRLDRDVGKHGDTGWAELAQLERVRARKLDASVVSSVTLQALAASGAAEDLRVVWTSPPYHHCNFTVLHSSNAEHDRFRDLLLSMDAADPAVCEAMREEYVHRWVAADDSGYGDLLDAVRHGPWLWVTEPATTARDRPWRATARGRSSGPAGHGEGSPDAQPMPLP